MWRRQNNRAREWRDKPKMQNAAATHIKELVVEEVEKIAAAWPLEPIVSEPRADPAVKNASERDGGVEPDKDGQKRHRVVEGRLDRVHRGAGEGGWIPRLVVEAVHVPVKKLANVRYARGPPRVLCI